MNVLYSEERGGAVINVSGGNIQAWEMGEAK